jgi:hypothetical protein
LIPVHQRCFVKDGFIEDGKEKLVPPSTPQVFSNITPGKYATLTQKANAAGINMSGNSGTASQFGVEVSWSYSAEACELTIQCLNTPFFVSPATVNARIKALVEQTAA